MKDRRNQSVKDDIKKQYAKVALSINSDNVVCVSDDYGCGSDSSNTLPRCKRTRLFLTLALIFGIEVLATALLIAVVIYATAYTKGSRGFGSLAISSVVSLDIFFLAFISGASMNPARSLAPAVLSGALGNLWLAETPLKRASTMDDLLF